MVGIKELIDWCEKQISNHDRAMDAAIELFGHDNHRKAMEPSIAPMREIRAVLEDYDALKQRVKALVIALDQQFGMPCEQIRHMQEVEALEQTIASQKQTFDALAKNAEVMAAALEPLSKVALCFNKNDPLIGGAGIWTQESNFKEQVRLSVGDAFTAQQALSAYRGE